MRRNAKNQKRVAAGRRSAEKKSERLDELLYNVEGYDPSLVPLARKWNVKIPAYPKGKSRFEYFLEMYEEDPDAATYAAEDAVEDYVKKFAKEQWTQEEMEEEDEETLDYLLDRLDDEEVMSEEEMETFATYLEDVLTDSEVNMLTRVLSREGTSDRQLTCFFRAAKKKLERNGSVWR